MILEKKIPFSYWFRMLRTDLITVTIFAVILHISSNWLPDLHIPLGIGTFLGTAIALLLSFKLSQSYDRWWEARKIWGSIVNDSRSFVVQLKNYCLRNDHPLIRNMAFRQIAWCHAFGQALRDLDPIKPIKGIIPIDEVEQLNNFHHVPLTILDMHAADLAVLHREGMINDYQQMQVDDTLVRLCASMGMAERINNTVFPKTYRLSLHFSIYIFLVLLAFSFVGLDSFVEVPLLVAVSIPFFLMEKIAYSIQDPFENKETDTNMTQIACTIETNLRQLVDQNDVCEIPAPGKFYAM